MPEHLAVIMARGRSERMGRPKGLCRLPGAEHGFLRTLVELFRQDGLPVLVVTSQRDRSVYAAELGEIPVRWAVADTAGDTARTAGLALAAEPKVTYFWLQPVDQPLVARTTLHALREACRRTPDAIVRPVHDGRPGHPVVFPRAALQICADLMAGDPTLAEKPLRVIIKSATDAGKLARPEQLAVDDPGTIRDFDTPEDLES